MIDPAVFLSDEELEGMKSRAFWRAARSWEEARKPGLSNSARLMLAAEAESASATWDRLNVEVSRRAEARRVAAGAK